MTSFKVIVKSVGDEVPAFTKDNITMANMHAIVIVEKATAGGKTGITIVFEMPDGKKVAAQTTAALMNGFASALKGAEDRFAAGTTVEPPATITEAINALIKQNDLDTNQISDGYHTFGELYEHRSTNYLALCRMLAGSHARFVWRSLKHSDGELAFGGSWFVLGIGSAPGEQITYHLPIEAWNKTGFAETLEIAPTFDGHTPDDVLVRLAQLEY